MNIAKLQGVDIGKYFSSFPRFKKGFIFHHNFPCIEPIGDSSRFPQYPIPGRSVPKIDVYQIEIIDNISLVDPIEEV